METLSTSSCCTTTLASISKHTQFKTFISASKVPTFIPKNNHKIISLSTSKPPLPSSIVSSTATKATPTFTPSKSATFISIGTDNHHWMVLMESLPQGVNSKPEIIDYYVKTLERVLGRWPGVLSVRPDPDYNSAKKVALRNSSNRQVGNLLLFPGGNTKHWLVRIAKPGVGVVTKAQMVDYYTQLLVKVMGK